MAMSVYVVVIAKCAILTNLTAFKYPIKRFGTFVFELILLNFAGIKKKLYPYGILGGTLLWQR